MGEIRFRPLFAYDLQLNFILLTLMAYNAPVLKPFIAKVTSTINIITDW
jgi:hypothetical protein